MPTVKLSFALKKGLEAVPDLEKSPANRECFIAALAILAAGSGVPPYTSLCHPLAALGNDLCRGLEPAAVAAELERLIPLAEEIEAREVREAPEARG